MLENTREGAPAVERLVVSAATLLLTAEMIAATAAAFGLGFTYALPLFALVAIVCTPALARRLPAEWDGARRRHPLTSALWLLLALVALVRTGGLALYMADPTHAEASAYWFDAFYTRHNCFSAYWRAAELAAEGVPNLYDPEHYAGWYGRFKIDEFMYLPQFAILPMAGVAAGADYEAARAVWFTLESAIVAAGFLLACVWIGGPVGRRAALFALPVWLSTPVLLTLQLGNYQLAAIALSVLAMLAFERGRNVLGGLLFSIALFKVFPGILGIYLLANRRWKAVGITLGFSLLFALVGVAWLGQAPFMAFFEFQLPRMLSGETWGFLDIPELAAVVAINDSVPGVVQKLRLLGVPGTDRAAIQAVAWIWTAVIAGAAILAGLRAGRMSRLELVACWIGLLGLAAFRSPFLPDHYGLFAPLWIWSLAAAARPWTGSRTAGYTVLWLLLSAVLPFAATPLAEGNDRLALSALSQVIAIGLCLFAALRPPAAAGEPLPSPRAVAAAT